MCPAQQLDQVHHLVLEDTLQRLYAVSTFKAADSDWAVARGESLKQNVHRDSNFKTLFADYAPALARSCHPPLSFAAIGEM